jgi:hypothetical protein
MLSPSWYQPFFMLRSFKMAMYLQYQDEVKIEIDEDNDLVMTQVCHMTGEEDTILVNCANIDWFLELLEMARAKGCVKESDDGLV